MTTRSGRTGLATELARFRGVATRTELSRLGYTSNDVANQLRAGRWRKAGPAVVLHNGPLTPRQQQKVALIGHGPRSKLTSFTALAGYGLKNWDRDAIYLLVPPGTARFDHPELPRIVRHFSSAVAHPSWRAEMPAHCAIRAAGSLTNVRHACGLLAACVQQRIVTSGELRDAIGSHRSVRHRAAMVAAIGDLELGAQALSEIDFVKLCRKHRLPAPRQQVVRRDSQGRRRYLDAEWDLPRGRTLVAEVDGAIHLSVMNWINDQLRQNEVVLTGSPVLRYPTVIVRHEEIVVVRQLRRALAEL